MQLSYDLNVTTIPVSGVAEYVSDLAQKHGIRYVNTTNDALADIITQLSDDIVVADETENLIVALRRAQIIDAQTMVALLGNYLDEKNSKSK